MYMGAWELHRAEHTQSNTSRLRVVQTHHLGKLTTHCLAGSEQGGSLFAARQEHVVKTEPWATRLRQG
jgi:hypothetical protein